MKTAVIYARQSFGLEEGSASLDVQVGNCQKWAKDHGVNVIGVFQDANTSSELYPLCQEGIEACKVDKGFQLWKKEQKTKGRKEYKQGLGQAFNCIRENKPDYLIVYTENRLGRSATNSNLKNFTTSFLMDCNCSLVDVQSNNVFDFSDKLMMAFRAMKDALDYQGVYEKRKASMESVARRINSHRVVSNAYGVVATNGVIGFDQDKAEAIRYVFEAVASGSTYPCILHTLNTKYRHLAKGRQWYQTNIAHILENLVYCGYSKDLQGEVARAINIPNPIVSYAQFAQASRMAKAKKAAGYQKHQLKQGKQRHWLPWSGRLVCECGRRMTMACDNGVVYRCPNDGSHTLRIRTNAINHGQDFNLTMQALFAVRCVQSRRELEACKSLDTMVDALKCKVSGLESAIRAKFKAIESEADYELLKGEIGEAKSELARAKGELEEALSKRASDINGMEARLDEDFSAILEPRLLDEASYQRLLCETVDKVVVGQSNICVWLCDGNKFELPRLVVDGRGGKVLPWSEVQVATACVENLNCLLHHTIVFHGGGECKILVDNEFYSIILMPN